MTASTELWAPTGVGPYPYIVTGADVSGLSSPQYPVALWDNVYGPGPIAGNIGLYYDVMVRQLTIGDGASGSPGISLLRFSGDTASIWLAGTAAPIVNYVSDSANGRHRFTGNVASSTAVVDVVGGITGTWFNHVNITDPSGTGTNATLTLGNTSVLSLTANKSFSVLKSLTLTGTDSTTMTFPATSATIARTDTAQTFTGVQTFSAQDVHTLGIDLSTSGSLVSNVVTGGSAIAFDHTDNVVRSGANEYIFRLRGTESLGPTVNRTIAVISWDGRLSVGYGASVAPVTGAVLGFTQTDSNSATGSPHYVGVYALVDHSDAAKTAAYGPFGVIGISGVLTTTGLTGNLQAGFMGSVYSVGIATATGNIFSGFVSGLMNKGQTAHLQPVVKDPVFPKSANGTVAADHITGYWTQVLSTSSTTGYGTSYPGLVTSLRACIQDWGAPITDAANSTEYWSIYGENATGVSSIATYPAVTGYLRMTYPRRFGRTGVRAMHAWWEPWPNTSTIRGGGVKGDTYFDDGTNFRIGLWEHDGTAYHKLLQYTQTDAISGTVAPATLAVTTGGATGPTTAGQAKWAKVMCLDGTAGWVPVWV